MNVRESKPQNRVGLPRGLFLRGKGYALRVSVPTEYQDIVGKREIVRGLGTQDLAEALKRRPRVLEEILEAITEGQTPSQAVRPNLPKQENTVRDTADRWLAESDGINSSTKVRYRQHLRTFETYSGNIQVKDINRSLALGFIEHLKATPSRARNFVLLVVVRLKANAENDNRHLPTQSPATTRRGNRKRNLNSL
ncbi:DUF6538 domain-containing protein [Ruegeria arenilitoris]|uniref:DUF6538 domain-containing protein n=1 Tax=Ruegeria arenilitoris TaxID=1173585 RepID=UPI003463F3F9